jgi:hypothetical protein
MALDVEQERKRQKREGTTFEGILDSVGGQMQKYLDAPFDRTGLISELHYGQVLKPRM